MDVDFSLTPHQIATLDVRSIIVLGVAAIAVTMILGFHLMRAAQCGILMRHSIGFAVFAALIVIPTIYLADTHYLHFHHYCLGLFFVPFCRFDTIVSKCCLAFFLGLAVEGVSRWGLDPVWYPLS